MYFFDFPQRFRKPCMGHFFVVRNENVPNVDTNITSDVLVNLKGTGYKMVFGGEYGKFIDASELFRSLQHLTSDNGTYKFRSGDVLILVANNAAYAYVMNSAASYYINKNTFAEECARDFGNTYLRWGNRNLLFATCSYEFDGQEMYDGYAVEVYDEKGRLLFNDKSDSLFQNWFILLNQALMDIKEPVYDEYYHTFYHRTAGNRDKTSLVPEHPEGFFYVTDNAFIERSVRRLEEEKKERLTADVHRKAMNERYGSKAITPDVVEDVALCHIMKELEHRADEPIAVKDVIFHSFSKEGNEAVANVVVEYESNMTESYVHDLLCINSCTYSKGIETVYVEFVPIRKEQTGTFADYLSVAKTGVSKKALLEEGIETRYNGKKAYIIPGSNEEIKDEMLLPVYDADGTVMDRVSVYAILDEESTEGNPLLFAEIGGKNSLSDEQRFNLLELFEGWYSEQVPYGWSDEFPMLVSMIISKKTGGAVLINPRHIPYDENFFNVLCDILWPQDKAPFSVAVPFWIGCVEHETGKILEVHTEAEAKAFDYHEHYFSEEIQKRHEECGVGFFWIKDGKVVLDPEDAFHSDDGGAFLTRSIEKQIRIVSSEAAVLIEGLEKEA